MNSFSASIVFLCFRVSIFKANLIYSADPDCPIEQTPITHGQQLPHGTAQILEQSITAENSIIPVVKSTIHQGSVLGGSNYFQNFSNRGIIKIKENKKETFFRYSLDAVTIQFWNQLLETIIKASLSCSLIILHGYFP